MSNIYPVQSGFAGAKQLHGVNPVKCAAYFIGAKTQPRYYLLGTLTFHPLPVLIIVSSVTRSHNNASASGS